MKKLFNYTLPVVALCVLASCSEDATTGGTDATDTYNGKELIAFSGEGNAITRATLTRGGFDSNTKVVVRIKAKNGNTNSYRYTQAVMTAGEKVTTDDDCNTNYGLGAGVQHSHMSYKDGWTRFWDDAFGRDSKLTVYAVAVPNKDDNAVLPDNKLNQTGGTKVNEDTNPNWYTIATENTKIDWKVSDKQSSDTRPVEDLAYSNNIKEGETVNKGRYHQTYSESAWTTEMNFGPLSWQAQQEGSTTGKFDRGHLVFKHALAWIEINLKEGAGFNNNSNGDFTWTNKPANCAQTITLTGFPNSGNLDISTGEWSDMVYNVPITQMDETTGTPEDKTTRKLHGYVLPGTNLFNTGTNVIEFEIDNAKYYVTGTQIANAIRAFYREADPEHGIEPGPGHEHSKAAEYREFTVTEAGKHYIINLTVAKKGIDNVTAAILDWETVNSTDADAKNTYATFDFEDRSTRLVQADAAKFDIYRAAITASDYITGATGANYEWKTGYTAFETPYTANKANKQWDTDHWKTDWYWKDNKTYYHFRAAGTGTSASDATTITKDTDNGDYFTIKAGAKGSTDYKDYVWGAPFKYKDNVYKISYSNSTGFDCNQTFGTGSEVSQISQAIGTTDSQIKMLLFHMTSQIQVNVMTTTDNSEVVLYKPASGSDPEQKTKVEILNFLPNGKVRMGTGLVQADEATAEVPRTTSAEMAYGTYTTKSGAGTDESPYVAAHVDGFKFGMVPQSLTYGSGATAGTIGLRITTPDGNQYVVKDLSTCKGTVSETNLKIPYTSDGTSYTINEWFPHYRYTYTVTIKKTGIQNITAAVLPWETVTGDLGTIDLEN